jgi:hypothetical protein
VLNSAKGEYREINAKFFKAKDLAEEAASNYTSDL